MSSCYDCGSPVTPEDRFCGNCGLALRPADGANSSAEGAAASSSRSAAVASDVSSTKGVTTGPNESKEHGTQSQPQESGDEFLPTIIESSHGGQAAAPARSSESDDAARASESANLSSSAKLSSTDAEDTESTADSGEPLGEPSLAVKSAESASSVQGVQASTGSGSAVSDDDRRRTGDLPARSIAYAGRTGGSRRASSQLEPGTVLNARYEIVKRIGGGGMGAVYYAKDRNLGDAPRAVKEMIQTHLDESQQEKAVADFRRESMLLASLEHPSIPTIYDYFYDDAATRFYLVMKYIAGGDCLARLRNAPGNHLDELTVADWGMQAADVLEYLHNQRPPIIYRDLKPANLMIDGNNGRVMLIDFGIARWVAPQEKGVTAVGTMGYAPPELFSGKAEARTDIYGLGATMFHLLTGADPQDNPLLIFDFAKNQTPRQINPAISNEIEWILMRAVEYEPERRFRSAAEMRDALAQHIERLRAGAVTYGVVRDAQDQSARTLAVERVFCGFCGKSISSEDVFCPHCGARQPIAAASASLRAARATARLVVTGTTELDATFLLNKETNLVGRTDPQSNIFPDIDLSRFDPETKISRRHARVWREGDTFLVEDLGSVNGTVVNDAVRLGPRQPRPLADGDRLRLGETTLHFLIG
jgi:serine/threonine-protein kinase